MAHQRRLPGQPHPFRSPHYSSISTSAQGWVIAFPHPHLPMPLQVSRRSPATDWPAIRTSRPARTTPFALCSACGIRTSPTTLCSTASHGNAAVVDLPTRAYLAAQSLTLTDTAARLAASSRWEYDDLPYWGGEVDCSINSWTLANGPWLGADVEGLAAWFVEHRMADGGWNCEWVEGSTRSSFHSTLNALRGLLAHEAATGGSDETRVVRGGRARGAAVEVAHLVRHAGPVVVGCGAGRGLGRAGRSLRAKGPVPTVTVSQARASLLP